MTFLAAIALMFAIAGAWALVIAAGEFQFEGRTRAAVLTALLALAAVCLVVALALHLGEGVRDHRRHQVDACVDAGGHPVREWASAYCSFGSRASGGTPDHP